jgi:Domain of unknown function (DUF4331)
MTKIPTRRRRRTVAVIAATGALFVAALPALAASTSSASSHREAPLIAADPTADNTDVYAFVSPERPDYVTLLANWIPFEEPNGGPNFYPFATDAAYLINVDNDGDAVADAVFRWTFNNIDNRGGDTFLYNNGPVNSFNDATLLFKQTYTLESSFNGQPFQTRISDAPVAPSFVGRASMPNYQALRDEAVMQLDGGWNIFAGQADDPFFLDLRVFDLLYGGDLSETGQDTLSGYNVNTIALQVPFTDVALNGDASRNPVIGVWSTTERNRVRMTGQAEQLSDDRVQVSRLGNPLVNEVVIPANLKDAFNSISPDQDAGVQAAVDRVLNPELPMLIEAIYGVPAPATPRNDLFEIYLTGITTLDQNGPIDVDLNSQLNNQDVDPGNFQPSEMLRLNLSIPPADAPNRLGVLAGDTQGFPNGRRLIDDVVDISIQAVEGAAQTGQLVDALAAGDAVDQNNVAFGDTFPYVALPNMDAVNGGGGGAPQPAPPASPGATPSPSPAAAAGAADDMEPMQMMMVVGGAAGAAGLGGLGFWWWWRNRKRNNGKGLTDHTVPFDPVEG